MLNRASGSLQRSLGRVAPLAIFGARLYLVLAVIQFVAGFVIGGSMVLFDYNLDYINVLLPTGN